MAPDPLSFLDDELAALREQGLFRSLRVLDGEQTARATFDHRSVVNLSSNNYLGLTTHPAAAPARARGHPVLGVGSGSVRTIAGTMALHVELEQRLARFKETEAAVVFQSGFAANAGTVAALLGRDDIIVSDELNHASIIDGARLSRATIKVFPHRDAAAARAIVEGLPRTGADAHHHRRRVQHGRRPRCAARAGRHRRGARLHHDGRRRARQRRVRRERPRHGRSLRPARPRRTSRWARCRRRSAALGGYVAGSRSLIEFLHHRARPFLFSTSHPPSVAATCIGALDVLEQEPKWQNQLWANTRFFKKGLSDLGFDTAASESPITPVIVGDGALAMRFSDRLFELGVFAQGIALSHRAPGQGARPHDRDRHAHAGRAGRSPWTASSARAPSWASSMAVAPIEAMRRERSAASPAARRPCFERLHAGPQLDGDRAAVHARHRRTRTGSSPATSTSTRWRSCRGTGAGSRARACSSWRSPCASARAAARSTARRSSPR